MGRKEYRLAVRKYIKKTRDLQRSLFMHLKTLEKIENPSSVEECVSMVRNLKPKVKRKEYEY